jgi:hypothetical protein
MTKGKTKKQLEAIELEKYRLTMAMVFIGFVLFFGIIAVNVKADQIVHGFKNPSFSGVGTSSHYLTIENQEFNRKENIKAELKAYKEQLKRDAENTTLARFIRNLESRIYAQLSRQLVDALFGDTPQTQGIIELMGNTIEYSVSEDGTMITLKITDPDGNTTEITVPIGSFTF